ncbi:FHA domain-containing protein [Siccibacter colletis]|uniref:FHA domain-containing protein n=1 Tax=Siccibacter colletis TaxID=1505757 RepID=UPI003CEF3FBA
MMFELRVLSGLHLGAALPLFGDSWVLGQSADADLLLSDDGIGSAVWRLHCHESEWALEQPGGEQHAIACGTPFTVGPVWLAVADADTPWTPFVAPVQQAAASVAAPAPAQAPRKSLFTRAMRVAMVSMMLLLTFTVVSWILQPTVAQTQVVSGPGRMLNVSDVKAPLLKMLRERDLGSAVAVIVHEKSVELKGKLSDAQMEIFNRMMGRFNDEFKTAVPVVNKVEPLKVELPFRIVQITTGSRANIVTDDGQRLFIGDEVDELRLVSITGNQIEFSGRENIKVSW